MSLVVLVVLNNSIPVADPSHMVIPSCCSLAFQRYETGRLGLRAAVREGETLVLCMFRCIRNNMVRVLRDEEKELGDEEQLDDVRLGQ